jgi:ketosteroid isomerase-like protein
MSAENVALFRRAIAALNAMDVEEMAALADPQAEFLPLRAPVTGAYVGPEGLRRFVDDTRQTFDEFHASYDDVRDLGDRLLAMGVLYVRGRGSGAPTETSTAVVVEFRDGRIARIEDFGDRRRALEAVGLQE